MGFPAVSLGSGLSIKGQPLEGHPTWTPRSLGLVPGRLLWCCCYGARGGVKMAWSA